MPDERLLQLFSPQDTTQIPDGLVGTGLDLWLCYRIVQAHKGAIVAQNVPSGGTEFIVSLPIQHPTTLSFQSPKPRIGENGFSPILVLLSDVLPPHLYLPHE